MKRYRIIEYDGPEKWIDTTIQESIFGKVRCGEEKWITTALFPIKTNIDMSEFDAIPDLENEDGVEYTLLLHKRYRTQEGSPTCSVDFRSGRYCEYFRSECFGTRETCVFAPIGGHGYLICLERTNEDTGWLIPGKWCPLWKGAM